MKVKNSQIVNFFNMAGGILKKEIPYRVYTAVTLNLKGLNGHADTYSSLMNKITEKYTVKDGEETQIQDREAYSRELQELLEVETEAVIQTIPAVLLEQMDSDRKFSALSGQQYEAIDFMVETPE